MVPVLVEWGTSSRLTGDPGYVVRTLNTGGNPIAGTNVLCSARIPAHGVERVEFIIVPHDRLGKRALVAHTKLRFVFAPGHEVQLLSGAGVGTGGDATVPDLILSWEAWRPPGVPYDALKGLDPHVFDLTMRAYAGAQRFLEDAVMGREWIAYSLRLPGGAAGPCELLRVGLVLGDSVGRRSLDRLLGLAEARWLAHADVPNLAKGYTREGSESGGRVLNFATLPRRGSSAGGGYSTAGDLLKYVVALKEKKIFLPDIAGGLGIAGGAPGINSAIDWDVRSGYIIIVLTNFDPPTAGQAARRIIGWLPR